MECTAIKNTLVHLFVVSTVLTGDSLMPLSTEVSFLEINGFLFILASHLQKSSN